MDRADRKELLMKDAACGREKRREKRTIVFGEGGIRQAVIKILLSNLDRIAAEGNAKETIALSKYILKLAKQSDQECFEFCIEQCNCPENAPPEAREENIGQSERGFFFTKPNIQE